MGKHRKEEPANPAVWFAATVAAAGLLYILVRLKRTK